MGNNQQGNNNNYSNMNLDDLSTKTNETQSTSMDEKNNVAMTTQVKQPEDVNYNNDYENVDVENIDLRNIWIENVSSKKKKNYRVTYLVLLFVVVVITCVIWVFAYKYDKYIIDYGNWIEGTNKISDTYEKVKEKIYKLVWKEYQKPVTSIKIDDENWVLTLRQFLESNISYINKKETLKSTTQSLFNSVINSANHLDETKKHINNYWFFSDKLSSIISDDESITSIQDSLTAIESIKFSSAISVFSKLDTFLASISKEIWFEKEEILAKMESISKRWEKDINLYIRNCKLNAAELNDYQCNNIWDFDKYYELTEDSWFDIQFFKYLIEFIDAKLEQTEIPSFSIKFDSFNQQSKEMSFSIEINTFKEDEAELAKNWILSPHSFILNSLINNLRLSRVIVSELIKIESIRVDQVIKTFWTTEFVINTSSHNFTVPIKKENQIEIDDFSY